MNTDPKYNQPGGPYQPQQIIINQPERRGNGLGTAGFVLALLGIVLCWIPVFGWILWILGLIFSAVGVFRQPRGLAIAGLVLSLLGLITLIALAATFFSILTLPAAIMNGV